jgi:hypothetical protein
MVEDILAYLPTLKQLVHALMGSLLSGRLLVFTASLMKAGLIGWSNQSKAFAMTQGARCWLFYEFAQWCAQRAFQHEQGSLVLI